MDTITIGLNKTIYFSKFQTTREIPVHFAIAETGALTLENQGL
jgi:hypothetical protein